MKFGIVVPTLGARIGYLNRCLESLAQFQDLHVLVVGPGSIQESLPKNVEFVLDDGGGVVAAINKGLDALPVEIEWVGWLGDDDFLLKGANRLMQELLNSPQHVCGVGAVNYLNYNGILFGTLRPTLKDVRGLGSSSYRIAQPGSFFRREVNGRKIQLDDSLKYCFDQALFLELKRLGSFHVSQAEVACYTWHTASLSGNNQASAVLESLRLLNREAGLILRFGNSVKAALALARLGLFGSKLDKLASAPSKPREL